MPWILQIYLILSFQSSFNSHVDPYAGTRNFVICCLCCLRRRIVEHIIIPTCNILESISTEPTCSSKPTRGRFTVLLRTYKIISPAEPAIAIMYGTLLLLHLFFKIHIATGMCANPTIMKNAICPPGTLICPLLWLFPWICSGCLKDGWEEWLDILSALRKSICK